MTLTCVHGSIILTLMNDTLRPGTKVLLPDGTIAYASPNRRVGAAWDGTYYTTQGRRVDTGWRREQLTPA